MMKCIRYKFVALSMLILLSVFSPVMYAQDNSLKLLYSFKTTGTDVVDESGNAYHGILKNGASIQSLGKFNVLSLGTQNGYVDMTANTGKLINSLSDFTVSLYIYVDPETDLNSNGNFIWTFANSADMARTANGNMFLTARNTRYAISKTHWQNETSVSVNKALEKGSWKHLTYTQENTTGKLYLNGELVKTGTVTVRPADLGETGFNYIGRSCYSTDVYLKSSYLSDFRIYNRALGLSEITSLASNRLSLDSAMNNKVLDDVKNALVINGLDSVTTNLNLPADGGSGVSISWQSSVPGVISAGGTVVRPPYGSNPVYVTLRATLSKNGSSTTKLFVAKIIPYKSDIESTIMDASGLNLIGNITLLRSDLSLPAQGAEGSVITWTSGNPDVLSGSGRIMNRPAKGKGNATVKLTATVTKGSASTTKDFTIVVAEDEGFSAYLFAYFTGNSGDQEAIRFALSDDGYTYKALNKNNPIISSASISSTGGVRDPHILRGENNDYYMVVTDMVSTWGWNSNRAMVLMKSGNLINWQSSVINIPNTYPQYAAADRVWAPQTIFDPSVGKYMVYFAMRLGSSDYDKIYYAYANEDFTGFVSAPQLLFENNGKSVIDADIVFQDGKYHLFFKTEGNGNGIKKAVSDNLTSGYVLYDKYLQSTTAAVEGGCVYRMYNTDKWMLIYDMYTSGAYQFTETMDLMNFSVTPNTTSFDFTPRHGTIIPITSAEKADLLKKWGVPSGISHPKTLKKITLSPNPAKDYIRVSMENEIKPGTEMNITDCSGRMILKSKMKSPDQRLDISALQKNIYFLSVVSENRLIATTRFIVR